MLSRRQSESQGFCWVCDCHCVFFLSVSGAWCMTLCMHAQSSSRNNAMFAVTVPVCAVPPLPSNFTQIRKDLKNTMLVLFLLPLIQTRYPKRWRLRIFGGALAGILILEAILPQKFRSKEGWVGAQWFACQSGISISSTLGPTFAHVFQGAKGDLLLVSVKVREWQRWSTWSAVDCEWLSHIRGTILLLAVI